MYLITSNSRQISVLSVFPGSDSTDPLVIWFCDNSTQSVYKLVKSHSRANTAQVLSVSSKSGDKRIYVWAKAERTCPFSYWSVASVIKVRREKNIIKHPWKGRLFGFTSVSSPPPPHYGLS